MREIIGFILMFPFLWMVMSCLLLASSIDKKLYKQMSEIERKKYIEDEIRSFIFGGFIVTLFIYGILIIFWK